MSLNKDKLPYDLSIDYYAYRSSDYHHYGLFMIHEVLEEE